MSDEKGSGRGLFAVGDDVYDWDDVVALARLRGAWAELASQVKAGLAALADLEARGEPVSDEEVEVAARAFRYERDLLAADDLTEWLGRHRLSADDWHAYLSRAVAAEHVPGATGDASEDEVDSALWAEGICSGRLERLARELAELAAVSPGAPIDRLDAALADYCAEVVDERAEAREVETNRLEWMRFGYESVVAETEGAAHELVLCIRVDGDSLAAAADRAGLEPFDDDCWLDELDPAVGTRFLGATAGEIVGPVGVDGGFVVAHVIAKTAPALDDEAVRARAREAARTRAISRLVADRVVWL